MQQQDTEYVVPTVTTEAAKQIFCTITTSVNAENVNDVHTMHTPDNLITNAQFASLNGGNRHNNSQVQPRSRRASSPTPTIKRSISTLDTKDFESVREYESRVLLVGQHFSRASPCVRIESLNIMQRLVYEEWIFHRRNSTGATERTEYRCRRHAKPRRQRIVNAGTLFRQDI